MSKSTKSSELKLPSVAKGIEGDKRIVIDNVTPSVDKGLFPIKRAAGDRVEVETWLVCDGHDILRGVIQDRPRGIHNWRESELRLRWNDEWLGQFIPEKIGFHEYRIAAWVDHYESWYEGFCKKADAGVALSVEL